MVPGYLACTNLQYGQADASFNVWILIPRYLRFLLFRDVKMSKTSTSYYNGRGGGSLSLSPRIFKKFILYLINKSKTQIVGNQILNVKIIT